jgi:rhodanese-related sulfurtransferase/predicted metal-dependent enzyme (double-stranded beta helix superfamily)
VVSMHVHRALQDLPSIDQLPRTADLLSPPRLVDVTAELARQVEVWRPLVRQDAAERWYELLVASAGIEIWLIGWPPGQGTLPHDHGDANGALTVVQGALVEEVYADPDLSTARRLEHRVGEAAAFDPDHVHRVTNEGRVSATSIHAYSPPERPMRYYGRSVDQLLEQARTGLDRLVPEEAAIRVEQGALLVDIRPEAQRCQEGAIPGALAIERNVLEWRLDPASPARIDEVRHYAQPVIVICSGGYASSFAAATLRQLGLANATDVTGGYQAWAAAGLPTVALP